MKKIILFIAVVFSLSIVLFACNEKQETPKEDDIIENKDTEEPIDKKEDKTDDEKCEPVVITEKKKGSLFVQYVLDNGKRDIIEKVDNIEEYVFLDLTYEGHRFIGWYVDEEKTTRITISDLVMPTDENDIIIKAYAKWKAQSFTVTFMNGDDIIEFQTVEYGKSAKAPTVANTAYEKFIGWSCDFSKVTSDLVVTAMFEKDVKNIIVVLGNWMNDDGTMSATLKKRLALAIKAIAEFDPIYVVLTGGMANAKAGIAEATAMYNYLISQGIDKDLLIVEDQSMSTEQNAIYTFRLIQDYDFDNLIIVSTVEHFYYYGGMTYFNKAALNNSKIKAKNINIMIFTNNEAA